MNARVIPIYPADQGPEIPPQDDGPTLRTPPHSEEAEQSVLGALMIDNAVHADVAEHITHASFYRHAHRVIYTAICDVIGSGQSADVVSVFVRLQETNLVADAGGLAYLNALCTCVPGASNAGNYAAIVAQRHAERMLIAGLDEASTIAWQGAEPFDDRLARIAEVVRRVEVSRKGPAAHRVPLLSLGDLQKAAESVEWLVKRVIPADSIGMLFGGSGTFKTYLALDFALHVCHGLPWMGRKTRQGAVIYIAAEGGAGLWTRIQAWHKARGLDWKKAPLHVVPVPLDLTADAWRVVDAAQLAGVTPQAVVVDTLSQTYSGEENSANEMAAYFRTLGMRFRALWRCAVVLIHHSGHAATERPRGSSAIRSNIDFLLGAFRDEKEMLATLTNIKQKDGELFEDATFQLTPYQLGHDADGDAITQLAARHLSSSDEVTQAMEGEGKAGRGGKNQLLLRLLSNGMREQELRKAFYEDCDLDNAEARRQAYHRAKAWAMKAGFFEVAQGVVLVTKTWSKA